MHGSDWKHIIDQNTEMIKKFSKKSGKFFIKDLSQIENEVIITGSRKDDLIPDIERILIDINSKIKNSKLVLFDEGNHPAMFSNIKKFRKLVLDFLDI